MFRIKTNKRLLLSVAVFLYLTPLTYAEKINKQLQIRPAVSIIIDDIGDRLKDGLRAISIPAPYTCSFLPNTPFAKRLANEAFKMNKEIMMHLPMQSKNNKKLGPNGLTMEMNRQQFDKTLFDAFESIPHVSGINNHMGSLLTTQLRQMNWLMQFMLNTQSSLYFIDSKTTAKTVIKRVTKNNNILSLARDVFLDNTQNKQQINQQLHSLIKVAKRKGVAIAIAHPFPLSMDILEKAWPIFYAAGVDLLPVSELIQRKQQQENTQWQLSLSH